MSSSFRHSSNGVYSFWEIENLIAHLTTLAKYFLLYAYIMLKKSANISLYMLISVMLMKKSIKVTYHHQNVHNQQYD